MMFCSNCGSEINEETKVCPKCSSSTNNISAKSDGGLSSSVKKLINFIIITGIGLLILLPFHYVFGYGFGIKIISKEHLTFEYTFITEDTVEKIINRYNNANFLEKMQMQDESLFKKLMEEGIIYREKNDE